MQRSAVGAVGGGELKAVRVKGANGDHQVSHAAADVVSQGRKYMDRQADECLWEQWGLGSVASGRVGGW